MGTIIDAHLHLFTGPDAGERARQVGHENSTAHLRQVYQELGILHGVIMGNGGLELEAHDYPPDLFHYCVGLDSGLLGGVELSVSEIADRVEDHLRRESCCGVKLYPGYHKLPLSAPLYQPVYELARHYDKPVAVHMGLTSFPQAHLKYCHPLALDEIAADHPSVRFVMCHFGSPFWESAAAVLAKNPNVSADLSGLLEGRTDLDVWFREQAGYADLLRTWLKAAGRWDQILFGTDWPIVNLAEYIAFADRLLPEARRDAVFFDNANRVYGLGL
ncbi:MAG: amidohydrolase [Oscillibacter sp.]|nr:amidohydrolase [Oscillibacter sp.]